MNNNLIMKSKLIVVSLMIVMTASLVAKEKLPEGAIKKGSLSNQKLIRDTMVAAAAKVSILGCDKPETLQPYVLAMPVGDKVKVWKELWLIKGCNKTYKLKVSFVADGAGATYTIEK